MDRINHVKIVTPDPAALNVFLTEVMDFPKGWSLGDVLNSPPADLPSGGRAADGSFTVESVSEFRGAEGGGFIAGSPESKQFQIFEGKKAHIWGIALGTRNLEQAYERCVERGIPATPPAVTPWSDKNSIRFFFAEVAGIVFEVMRAEGPLEGGRPTGT